MNRIVSVPVGARRQNHRRDGGVLISMLAFVVVISVLTTGAMRLTVSHYQLAKTQADWTAVSYLAEAGVNYEIRTISNNANNADTISVANPIGPLYQAPGSDGGTFNVNITNRDGSTPWIAGSPGIISAKGMLRGVSRTIQIYCKPYGSALGSNYALFGAVSGTIAGGCNVTGNVGTNGTLSFSSSCVITGTVEFNGVGSNWAAGSTTSFSTVYTPTAKVWPTVDALAVAKFGVTGLAYLKANNDNLFAIPPVPLNYQIKLGGGGHQTFYGKPGGANYYLEGITLGGNAAFSFDNTLGPITIWVGPSGGSGAIDFQGGSAAVSMSTNPANPVKFFSAVTSNIIQKSNAQIDCEIYNINSTSTGGFIAQGSPSITATVIANSFSLQGNVGVTYVNGSSSVNAATYYLFDNVYTEQNVNY